MKKLKVGDVVQCPPDHGGKGYTGKILSYGDEVFKNVQGTNYVWVTVDRGDRRHVWPSNRLGYKL